MMRRICAALMLAACGHPAPTTAPTTHVARTADASTDVAALRPLDEDLPRLAERGVQMAKALLKVLNETGTDCAAAAAKINALADANADVTAANAKILHAGGERVKQLRAALEPYGAELDETAQNISKAITASNCAKDAAFSRAFDHFAEGS